jgi:hypothetical protein
MIALAAMLLTPPGVSAATAMSGLQSSQPSDFSAAKKKKAKKGKSSKVEYMRAVPAK